MPNTCPTCGQEVGDEAHTCGGVPLLSHINDMPLALKRIGELEAENAKLREENIAPGGASTMTACERCNRGVRPRYAVKGMCAECARARIAELEAMNT